MFYCLVSPSSSSDEGRTGARRARRAKGSGNLHARAPAPPVAIFEKDVGDAHTFLVAGHPATPLPCFALAAAFGARRAAADDRVFLGLGLVLMVDGGDSNCG